jgi:hypothetical protein
MSKKQPHRVHFNELVCELPLDVPNREGRVALRKNELSYRCSMQFTLAELARMEEELCVRVMREIDGIAARAFGACDSFYSKQASRLSHKIVQEWSHACMCPLLSSPTLVDTPLAVASVA